jgi:hypothetical protein
LPIHKNVVGGVRTKLKLSYGLGKKMIPKLVKIVCPNTCKFTGAEFEKMKTDGPK